MPRLFVACVPPPEIRRVLLDSMGGVDGARWQSEGQLHLTIRFVGDVDAAAAEQVAEQLLKVRGRAFAIALHGVGCFEKRGKAHTLWAGIAPSADAAALHRKVDRALVAIGRAREQRAYRPHITLARLARPVEALGPFLQANARLRSPAFTLDTLTLFESLPTSEGQRYEPVLEVPLS